MTTTKTENPWTAEAQDALRAEVRAIMARDNLKQTDVSKGTGIPYGTLTAWLAGTYAGDNAKQADAVSKWVSGRADRKRVESALPDAPGFQETPSALQMLTLFQFCQHAPDVGIIAAGAGVGKTTTAMEYQRRSSNVFLLTAEPVLRTPRNFLLELAQTVGLGEGVAARQSRAITSRLRNAGALIIVDEAQHLSTAALEQARAIHDRAQCGIVFVGNSSVYSRMGDGRAEFAQLFSRVGMRVTQQRPKDEDVAALVQAWGLDVDMRLPKAIARKPGALRGLTKCIRLAHVIAAGKQEKVGDAHLRAAFDQIGFERIEAA